MEVIVTIVRQVGFISLFRGRISNLLITRGYNPVTKYHGHPRKHSLKLRMRSEGFPFIVGVWGWTCVRVVFLVSSSPRRRVVVASSSPTR